jgi:hypothetical protein
LITNKKSTMLLFYSKIILTQRGLGRLIETKLANRN